MVGPRTIGRPATDRLVLAVVVAGVLTGELLVAWNTFGTADVLIFGSFASTVREHGPIQIYSLDVAGLNVYNHPPLVGWWLKAVVWGSDVGLPRPFMIRLPSVLAHAATVPLIWAILRRRVSANLALASALLVAVSPTLAILSGFHGNNDTVVALFTIASVYLLVDRRMPVLAGFAFSVAISVKIVPIIALPLLAVVAYKLGRRFLLRFALGGLPVLLVLWLPVLIQVPSGFTKHVIGYSGFAFPRVWGLYQLGTWLHVPESVLHFYTGAGAYIVLAVCSLLPAWLVRRKPEAAPAALGLAVSLFLTLSPAWAPQYMAWIAATVFLIEFWSAVVFTIGVGAVYIYFYSYWNGFKAWFVGNVAEPRGIQLPILFIAWLLTVMTAVVAVRRLRAPTANPTSGQEPPVVEPVEGVAAGSSSSEIR